MAFKKLSEYTSAERFDGVEAARLFLAYRKAMDKPLFNLLPFCTPRDIDPTGVDGSELVKVTYIDGSQTGARRKIGVEGTPINVVRSSETLEMDAINRTFQIDRRQIKSDKEYAPVVNDNMNDATYGVIDALLANLFKGTKGDDLNWNGLDYYFGSGKALNAMDNGTALSLSGGVVDAASALKFGSHLRKSINKMGMNKPTCIVTTAEGLELIQAYNQITNSGIKYVKVGDVDYCEFMGLIVCDMPSAFFASAVTSKGVPFYFLRLVADKTGFVLCTKNGEIFDPIAPDMNKHDGRVYEGSNEIVCVPIPCTTECAARCFVSTASSSSGGSTAMP